MYFLCKNCSPLLKKVTLNPPCPPPENDCSQVHVVTREVPKILNETLMLLKQLNGMHFNVLDILSGKQSLLSSQYVCHNSISASNAFGHGKSSMKR